MTTHSLTVAPRFGERLRKERERVKLNQTQLAEVAGIKRMAQSQYEKEVRSPTIKYLSAIAATGIDLHYLLFGSKASPLAGEQRSLEKRIFSLVEQYAQQQPDGQLGAEGRYAIFELLRLYFRRFPDSESDTKLDPAKLIAELA